MRPAEVENGSTDERVLDEERVEERRSVHDEVAQEDVAAARNVARQLPQTVVVGVVIDDVVDVVVVDAVVSDLFERLAYECSYPNANIGGQAVHKTEASDGLEFLNVQLFNQLQSISDNERH